MMEDTKEERHSDDVSSLNSDLKGKQVGVAAAEATMQIGGYLIVVIIVAVFLTSYVNGLDNNTMYAYQGAAAQTFVQYPLYLSVIQVLQQVIVAVGKFPIAKLSDVFGRAQGYSISLFFYVLGFIIIAACKSFGALTAGTVFYAIGNTGTQIMQQIILADYFPSKWRGLAIGFLSFPYLINFACAPLIVEQLANPLTILTTNTWRWGPGSFAIVAPVAIGPIILCLAIAQNRSKKSGLIPRHPYFKMPFMQALRQFCADMDLGCLFFITAGFVLVLLALGLKANAPDGYNSGYIIAMFVLGGVSIICIGLWEWLVASRPIMRLEYFLNKDIILPAFFIGFFDFMAFYISWSPAYYWSLIVKDFSNKDATYYSNTQSLCLTVFGIIAGAASLGLKRYKWILFAGCCIRLLGIGLMIRYRETSSTTVQVVFPQILQGMGGGFMGVTLQVAAQVSVRHQYVAMVTAFVLLMTEIGGACGTAILGSLQDTAVGVSAEMITTVYGSPFSATAAWPLGSPERTAFNDAWNVYMHVALIIAAGVSAVPIIASLFISDRKLGDGQNAISDEMTAGHLGSRQGPVSGTDEESQQNREKDDGTRALNDVGVFHPSTAV
ncbi:MFS general substrate transporter [Meira miltonrushii]|uniref:MFS general substrate transporter n=1 Tax=Meira miltonrushii TaxID=1280837 RepID=A0A316VGA4_9BASI|nr:MFS general substrate transporter [Meira miltonrushii]PWN35031.1 MFS general substrate transporter [Meira miltonrushii]